jgi:hypothetical protein
MAGPPFWSVSGSQTFGQNLPNKPADRKKLPLRTKFCRVGRGPDAASSPHQAHVKRVVISSPFCRAVGTSPPGD